MICNVYVAFSVLLNLGNWARPVMDDSSNWKSQLEKIVAKQPIERLGHRCKDNVMIDFTGIKIRYIWLRRALRVA